MGTDAITVQPQNQSSVSAQNNVPKRRGNPQYLKPWPKGVSGNPGGRPKKVTTALDKALTPKALAEISKGIIARAARGDSSAFVAVRETIEGKLPQPTEHSGEIAVHIAIERIG